MLFLWRCAFQDNTKAAKAITKKRQFSKVFSWALPLPEPQI